MKRFVHPKRRKEMSRLSTYALAIAVSLGTTAMLDNNHRAIKTNASAEARLAADGAFRDGMYLGKLAAESGRPLHPAIGRWSTDQDRATFTAGYRHGYNETLARIEP
jgi:hypothetical protein